MTITRRDLAALTAGLPLAWSVPGAALALGRQPLVIVGGGGGDVPTGARGDYELAIRDGADFIAVNVTPSKDGALVALRDHELSSSGVDVADRPEFAARRASRIVEGVEESGWFAEDFTLAELKALALVAPGARRHGRPGGADGQAILTFEDIVAIARAGSVRTARVIGVHATMLHPGYFAGLDLAIEPRLAGAISVAGYNAPAAAMFVASRDIGALKTIGDLTRARRVLRIGARDKAPASAADLAAIRAHAEAVAIEPVRLLDPSSVKTTPPTPLIADAHGAGLDVQAWTSDPDVVFPPAPFRSGDARRVLSALFSAGADAVEGDQAAPIARARAEATPREHA